MDRHDLDKKMRMQPLDQLEGVESCVSTHESSLVGTCHRLRQMPVGEFTVEDLRIMIGQDIGLFFLVPIALEVLERDALAMADYYPGDLLGNLLRVERGFWLRHSDWKSRLDQILAGMTEIPKGIAEDLAAWRRWTA